MLSAMSRWSADVSPVASAARFILRGAALRPKGMEFDAENETAGTDLYADDGARHGDVDGAVQSLAVAAGTDRSVGADRRDGARTLRSRAGSGVSADFACGPRDRFSDRATDKLLSDTASGRRGAVHGQSDVPLHELYGHALATQTAGRMGVGLGRNAAGQLSHGAGVAASGRRPCRAGDVRFFAEALLARGHSGRIARVSRCRRLYHRTTTAFRKTLAPTPNLCQDTRQSNSATFIKSQGRESARRSCTNLPARERWSG